MTFRPFRTLGKMGAVMREETGRALGKGGQIFLGALAATALVGAALIGWSVMGPAPDELTEIAEPVAAPPPPDAEVPDTRSAQEAPTPGTTETADAPEVPGSSVSQASDVEEETAATEVPDETSPVPSETSGQAGTTQTSAGSAAEKDAADNAEADARVGTQNPPQTAPAVQAAAPVASAEPAEAAEAIEPSQPEPVTSPASETAQATTDDAGQAADDANAPRFDLVRVDGYGGAVVAGRAPPGGIVRVLLDGEMVAQAVADRRGSFVALFSLGPSKRSRALTLEAESIEGTRYASVETALVSPFPEAQTDEIEPARSADATAGDAPADTETSSAIAETETTAATATAEVSPDTAAPEAPILSNSEAEQLAAVEPTPPPAPPVTAQREVPTPVVDATIRAETTVPARPAQGGAPAVSRPTAPSVVIVANDGARPASPVPQPDRPGLPGVANVVIDTISYDTEGEVVLVGRAQPNTRILLYLNNRLVEQAQVNELGLWRSRVTGIAQGIYTLRADEVDENSLVLSRFETPFERALREDALRAAQAQATQPAVSEQGTSFRDYAPGAQSVAGIVTVQPGFTLWRIARENYGDGFEYVRVFNSNRERIRDPDLIYPGQVFTVPGK